MCIDNGSSSDYSVFLAGLNTCPVESKLTRDFAAQCSLFTYSRSNVVLSDIG